VDLELLLHLGHLEHLELRLLLDLLVVPGLRLDLVFLGDLEPRLRLGHLVDLELLEGLGLLEDLESQLRLDLLVALGLRLPLEFLVHLLAPVLL
ncbi:hypothetical protein, partial [Rossellomorea marisflavi]